MSFKLLLSLTEEIFTCELPSIQPLAIYSCGVKICPTVHTSAMAVILHGSADEPQLWDLGTGQHSQIYECPTLHQRSHLVSFTQLFPLLVLYIQPLYMTKSTSKPWPVPGERVGWHFSLSCPRPPLAVALMGKKSQPNRQGGGCCVLQSISLYWQLKVWGVGPYCRSHLCAV